MSAAPLRLLYYCPWSRGGIADYAHAQATALADRGVDVTMLAPHGFRHDAPTAYRVVRELAEPTGTSGSRLARRLRFGGMTLRNVARLAALVRRGRYRWVLLGTYSEYLAPLWAWRLRALRRAGVRFAAVVHDPVRDYVVGPAWWHRRSVAAGYSFLDVAFVHESADLGTGLPPSLMRVTLPQGVYAFPQATRTPAAVRAELGIPDAARLALSFGHMRDNKNLDLILRAMAVVPDVHLVVAGSPPGGADRPLVYYRTLAAELGVADRCRWRIGHVPEAAAADLFGACDLVLLTYSRRFRSASAVLNVAAGFRRQCLVSAGPGTLQAVTQKYLPGAWVEPDSLPALRAVLTVGPGQPDWEAYRRDHTWERNAEVVHHTLTAGGV